ncbi:MAG: NAD(P)H-binding protein [Rhodocyclales bacterium]|jgi:uncharacterized protein YbjT (DUF2867 family)|nr:NAD(P)H-binding protein [Rhodocyclales bacterium]
MSKKILILGAAGQIARFAIDLFLKTSDVELTLYLRRAERMKHLTSPRVRIVEGDVLDKHSLKVVVAGHDVVYANLDGQLEQQAKNIIAAMDEAGVKRLIFVSSMGIYDEIPGERHGSALELYCRSAALVEASDLDYTIIRPAWLNNKDEIDYETTQKGDPFKNPGAVVSRKSVADLIVRTALSSNLHSHASLGVNKP